MIDIDLELQEQLQHLFAVQSPAITAAMKAAQSPAVTAAMEAAQSPAVTAAMKAAQSPAIISAMNNLQSLGVASAVDNLHSLGIASAIEQFQSPSMVAAVKATSTLSVASPFKDIFSSASEIVEQYQKSFFPEGSAICETAISVLNANIQQSDTAASIPYEKQTIDLSGIEDHLLHIEQQQQTLFNLVNECQAQVSQLKEMIRTNPNPLTDNSKEISVQQIINNLASWITILSLFYEKVPDTALHIPFKAELIELTFQIIISHIFLLPF